MIIACRNGASLSAYFSHFCGINFNQSSGILSPNEIREIKEIFIARCNGACLSVYFSHFCGTNRYQSSGILSPNEIREIKEIFISPLNSWEMALSGQGNDIIWTGKWLYQGRRKSSSSAVASSSSFFVASVAEEAFSSGFMLSKRR